MPCCATRWTCSRGRPARAEVASRRGTATLTAAIRGSMTTITFSISRVNRLRRAAERARALPEPAEPASSPGESKGWSISDCDPNDLLGVFKALRVKAGFALHAYDFRSGGKGNGIIWAVPANAPLLSPEDCPGLEDASPAPPKPPGAVPLMQAVEGDGSPWSHLSASILSREAAEFGARWHGKVWTDQTILSRAPRQAVRLEPEHLFDFRSDGPVGEWTWHRPIPQACEPSYSEEGTTKRVVLHARNPIRQDTIYRATDTYAADSYASETDMTVLCTSNGGFLYY